MTSPRMIGPILALILVLGLSPADVTRAADAVPAGSPNPALMTSPIEYFRSLLAMTPAQRQVAMALKPEAQRRVLEEKILEYGAMQEKERELRLRLLEVRLYLLPLMRMKPEDRGAVLARIPDKDRPFVEHRLRDWSLLSQEEQGQVLGNPTSLHCFLYRGYLRATTNAVQVSKITPPNLDAYRERMIARWQSLPEARRQEIVTRFDTFVTMEKPQRQAVLQRLPMPDQEHAQKTLRRVEGLTPDERMQFLSGLKKFADLDGHQRRRFLLQTERWSNMSVEERSLWRSIVVKVQAPPPPLPAGE